MFSRNSVEVNMKEIILNVCFKIIGVKPQINVQFNWATLIFNMKDYNPKLKLFTDQLGNILQYDYSQIQNIAKPYFKCDAFLGGKYNCILEFDDWYDFNSHRLNVLKLYPQASDIKVGFDTERWIYYCDKYSITGNKYQFNQKVNGFPAPNGKAAKRALIDCIKDYRSSGYFWGKMNPIVRLSYYELKELKFNFDNLESNENYKTIETILTKRLVS